MPFRARARYVQFQQSNGKIRREVDIIFPSVPSQFSFHSHHSREPREHEKSAGIRFHSTAMPRLLSIFIFTLASYRTADNPLLLIKERYVPTGPSKKSLLR